ncbi:DMP19 family protein [Flavobacteriaceae bacterium]|nr:DMP19 family protein [Flavobacteriaceae bacterium]
MINSISLKMTSTEIALLLNNDSEKIIRIGEIIGKKIKKRDNFEELNEFEKTFIFIDIFENHTTDGGFETFFWNTAGQFSHEILEAYEKIGAKNTASIMYDSFLLFGVIPIPKNTDVRREILSKINPNSWINLNEKYYNCNDNIVLLVLDFIKNNTKYFD